MLRAVLAIILIAAASLVVLWQLNVIELPFGEGTLGGSSSVPDIFAAARDGDTASLEASLAAGTPVDTRDEFGQTPLVYALSNQAPVTTVLVLLNAGADIDARTDNGWTPLMYAARDARTPEPVLLLMNAGSDGSARNDEGDSAYTLARGNAAIGSTLLLSRLQELADNQFQSGWPSGYVVPVTGATISSRISHLPGALRAYRNGRHEGFDFYQGTVSVPITYGTPIVAVAGGTVVRADHDYTEMTQDEYDEVIRTSLESLVTPDEMLDKLRGRQVWIEHPGGFVSRYAHLSSIEPAVQVGASVSQGSAIASTGNSGTSEAVALTQDDPHPHVEIWRGNTYLGAGMETEQIYRVAGQVFGQAALPVAFTD